MLRLDGESLTIESAMKAVRGGEKVGLERSALARMKASRSTVDSLVAAVRNGKSTRAIYGINTGFGELATTIVPSADLDDVQENLVRSHACGVGAPFDAEAVRAIMLLRANALAKGYSGVRPEVVRLIVDMLNERVHPMIPEKGSVGASGDLVPLAHLALTMIGEGEATRKGRQTSGRRALLGGGLRPVRLKAKEGLALVNGTQATTGVALIAVHDALNLIVDAQIAAGMSLESLMGSEIPLSQRFATVRPHPGHAVVASNLRNLIATSEIVESHRHCGRVQDAYSIRCIPQVLGASLDALTHARPVIEREMNSANDNPLIMEGDAFSGGNFHAQPVALVLAYVGAAVAEIASFSERRTARLVDEHLSELPAFLAEHPGLNNGLMIPQYVAASLVSENKGLAWPAVVDSIPTSANQEDHVSMGATAARNALQIVRNTEAVVAIEYMSAAQALDFKAPLRAGRGSRLAHEEIRRRVSHLKRDRYLKPDLDRLILAVRAGEIREVVTRKIPLAPG
ncbi:MAG: histidine ammonia-lyase [Euryarchaeota archaeon]|nr:histidine ammonia-lyase [Euryarchaeota archaeon]